MSETDKLASKAEPNPDTLARRQQGEGAMVRGWQEPAGALLPLGGLATAPAALAQNGEPILMPPPAEDFSAVKTKAAANKLVRQGRLVKVDYFPRELGGPEDPGNIGYVTPEAMIERELTIRVLYLFFRDGLIDHLEVVPEHRGKSVVPSRIRYLSRHSREGSDGKPYERLVEVWR